jgi:hypothetical protein
MGMIMVQFEDPYPNSNLIRPTDTYWPRLGQKKSFKGLIDKSKNLNASAYLM